MRVRLAVAFALCIASPALAQPVDDAPRDPATLGFSYDESLLRDLPTSDSVYGVFETIQPSLITDRFTGGGLFTGQPARVGGFLSSWTQTQFRIGDVDITDPTGSGAPLLFPELGPWRAVHVATGLLPDDVSAPGLAVTFEPRSRAGAWQHAVDAATSHGSLAAQKPTTPLPSIARLTGRDRLQWSSSGTLVPDRLRLAASASWTRATQATRDEVSGVDAHLFSMLGSLVHTSRGGSELTTIAWAQRSELPFEYRLAWQDPSQTTEETAVHVQSTWAPTTQATPPWRLFGSFSQRSRTLDASSRLAVVERLMDGPVSAVADPSRGTVRVGTVGARVARVRSRGGTPHHLRAGGDLTIARHQTPPTGVDVIGELVAGRPARVWQINPSTLTSSRRSVAFSAYGGDDIVLSSRLRASVGLRLESVTGDAAGSANGITWTTLLPRARLWWRTGSASSTVAFVGYTRSAYRLTLDLLAVGDPAAPSADVFRWIPSSSLTPTPGPLVARVGPGTHGQADFALIDTNLERPISDELSFGVEMSPGVGRRFQIALVGRRESGLFSLTNVGVPATGYTTFTVNDPGADTGKPDDDKVLTVYSRLPSTFGRDRYLLTTRERDTALSGGLELSGEWTASRLTMMGGATASIAVGPAATRGYGPLENDQSLPGDAFVSPNGSTLERGRLFADRAFTVKLAGVYRFPSDIRLGAIARYQDGQNFSRVLVFDTLAQGTEAVRAFAAGDSRFRFTGTLDLRLQKGFDVGRRRVALVLDAYNVLGLTYDVEENAAAQPNDRRGIAIQPPRTVHLGFQAQF